MPIIIDSNNIPTHCISFDTSYTQLKYLLELNSQQLYQLYH